MPKAITKNTNLTKGERQISTQHHMQQNNEEISLLDILQYIKSSGRRVLISTAVCLSIIVFYYLSIPKMYEAIVTIGMAEVAGEMTESPTIVLEKIKLPMFFSESTMRACGLYGKNISYNKLNDQIKFTPNRSAPYITVSYQSPSTQAARTCLELVIMEIQKSQNEIIEPLIRIRKHKIEHLKTQLKDAEYIAKKLSINAVNEVNLSEIKLISRYLATILSISRISDVNSLQSRISTLEDELMPHKTHSIVNLTPIYISEVPKTKLGLFALLGLSLAFGVFFGLLATGVILVNKRYASLRQRH